MVFYCIYNYVDLEIFEAQLILFNVINAVGITLLDYEDFVGTIIRFKYLIGQVW